MAIPGLNAYGITDVGRQRSANEDCFFYDTENGVFMVIDGVGGYAAGEVAAGLACDLVSRELAQRTGSVVERLRVAITVANNEIYRQSRNAPEQHGMACVLTVAVVEDGLVTIGHVGDTRLYEVGRDHIRKITRDHSPVGVREDDGDLSELEAMNHPRRNEIYRDLGSAFHAVGDDDFIDIYQIPWHSDRALLLCTDGLTDLVPKGAVHQVICDHAGRLDEGVRTLIELANEMGGTDNVTAVLVEGPAFAYPPLAEPAETFERNETPVARAAAPERTPRFWQGRAAFFAYGGLVVGLLTVIPMAWMVHVLDQRLTLAATPASEAVHTLHVAADGTGDYGSIGEALRAARPGDVVTLAPGVYRESILLKDRVAVVGPSSGAAVLRGLYATRTDSVTVRSGDRRVDGRSAEAPPQPDQYANRHYGVGFEAPGMLVSGEGGGSALRH